MNFKYEKLELLLNKILEEGGMSVLADSRKFRAYAKDLNEFDIMDLDRHLHFCDDSFLRYFYDARNDTSGKEIIQAGKLTEQYLVDTYYMNDERAGEFSRLFTEVILQYKRLDPHKTGKQTESILKKGEQVNELIRSLSDPDFNNKSIGKHVNELKRSLFDPTFIKKHAHPDQIIKAIQSTDEAPPSGVHFYDLAESGQPVYAWFESDSKTIYIYTVSDKVYLNEDSKYLFSDLKEFNELYLDFNKIDTSSATNMSYMFYGCSNLRQLDLSGFDTKSVTAMDGMFSGCSNLWDLNLNGFETASVTSMEDMFAGCSNLMDLNLSGLNTTSVTNMCGMFFDCSNLWDLNLSGFNTKSVTNMASMFYGCSKLEELDLSGFDTKSVTNMSEMFLDCRKLRSLITDNQDILKAFKMENGEKLQEWIQQSIEQSKEESQKSSDGVVTFSLNPDDYVEETFNSHDIAAMSCIVHKATDTVVFVGIIIYFGEKKSKVTKDLRNLTGTFDSGECSVTQYGLFRGSVHYIHKWNNTELNKAEKSGTLRYAFLDSSDTPRVVNLPFSRKMSVFSQYLEKEGFWEIIWMDVEKEMMPYVFPERCGTWDRVPLEDHFANVKHFFTLLGNEFFTSYGKQFFTLYGKKIFTLYGKQFFTLPGREFFTSLSGSRLSRQVLCQLKISGCLSR